LARKPRNNGNTLLETADYRHEDKRKNIPSATMERQGTVRHACHDYFCKHGLTYEIHEIAGGGGPVFWRK